ncbi:hypothetical protein Ancab_030959 [Ancistrocladus abbreviatus]
MPDVSLGRTVLLRVHGIPLQVWIEEFLAKIESRWGEFISIDSITKNRSRLNYAKVPVHTTTVENIAARINIKVDSVFFKVRVSEEQSCIEVIKEVDAVRRLQVIKEASRDTEITGDSVSKEDNNEEARILNCEEPEPRYLEDLGLSASKG